MKICCLCEQPIKVDSNGWDGGHNPEPLRPITGYPDAGEEARCCEDCNNTKVIPARMKSLGYSTKQIEELKHLMI